MRYLVPAAHSLDPLPADAPYSPAVSRLVRPLQHALEAIDVVGEVHSHVVKADLGGLRGMAVVVVEL